MQGPLSSLVVLKSLPTLSSSLRERLSREKVMKYGFLCESSWRAGADCLLFLLYTPHGAVY